MGEKKTTVSWDDSITKQVFRLIGWIFKMIFRMFRGIYRFLNRKKIMEREMEEAQKKAELDAFIAKQEFYRRQSELRSQNPDYEEEDY